MLACSLAVAVLVPLAAAQNPTPYCTAGTSTNGCTPSISANVQPNTTNTAGCVITTSGVEGQKQGIVFYGVDNATFSPTPWGAGGTSFLCVKPPTMRLGSPGNSGGTFGQCDGSYVVNWDAFQAANPTALGNPWVLGDKVFVQSWHRDPSAVKTSNLSNALELTLRNPPPVPGISSIPGLAMIPAGTFMMGSAAPSAPPYFGQSLGQPVHQVTISQSFWMGAFEVTQSQYFAVMGENPSHFPPSSTAPVERVSWFEARAYCEALTASESMAGNVPFGYQYRLPTEAEWEYACRAGTTTEFSVGAALLCADANITSTWHSSTFFCAPNPVPVSVGSFAPNAWGLFDMHGNVYEWCLDSVVAYSQDAVVDPLVSVSSSSIPEGYRVHRGGSWNDGSQAARSAARTGFWPWVKDYQIGFRVVLAPILVP